MLFRSVTIKELTGSGNTEHVAETGTDATLTDWSRDGRTLFYSALNGLNQDVFALPLDGDRKPVSFLSGPYNEYDARLSPDGRFLAYTSTESGREEIYVQPYPDRSDKWQVSTRGGNDPVWGADGKQLYYLSSDNQMMSVPVRLAPTFAPGTPEALFDSRVFSPGGQKAHYCVTRDGGTFILLRTLASRALPTMTVVLNWQAGLETR